MTQKDKKLLLKDLCARLPYGVKGNFQNSDDRLLCSVKIYYHHLVTASGNEGMVMTGDIKPYLFPLSSMTEGQYEKFIIISGWDGDYEDIKSGKFSCVGYIGLDYIYDTLDWLNANHFDYRGLIEKNLAINATNLNIY